MPTTPPPKSRVKPTLLLVSPSEVAMCHSPNSSEPGRGDTAETPGPVQRAVQHAAERQLLGDHGLQRDDDHRRDQRARHRGVVVVHEHRPGPRQQRADRDHRADHGRPPPAHSRRRTSSARGRAPARPSPGRGSAPADSSPTAAAGTVATLAHGVVKCAIRLVSASTTTTTRDVDVDAEVVQRRELTEQRVGRRGRTALQLSDITGPAVPAQAHLY